MLTAYQYSLFIAKKNKLKRKNNEAETEINVTKIYRQTVAEREINLRAFCPICRFETQMLSLAESALFLEIEDRMLEGLIAVGEVHAIQTTSGSLCICKNSLFK